MHFPSYPILVGLQKPLEFKGIRGRFLGWMAGIVGVAMMGTLILLTLIMQFVLAHTRFGRYTIAIGSNKEAAILSGINVKFYHVMVYVVSGLFAGMASIAYAAVIKTVQPGTGAGMELDAIGGAIVGGVSASGGYGTIYGTVIGAYVILFLKQGLPYIGFNANMQQIITGFVLIGAVTIDIIKRKVIR